MLPPERCCDTALRLFCDPFSNHCRARLPPASPIAKHSELLGSLKRLPGSLISHRKRPLHQRHPISLQPLQRFQYTLRTLLLGRLLAEHVPHLADRPADERVQGEVRGAAEEAGGARVGPEAVLRVGEAEDGAELWRE